MRSSAPVRKRLTQTEPPPAKAAQGCEPAGTATLATTFGVAADPAPAVRAAAAAAMSTRDLIVRNRSKSSGFGLSLLLLHERRRKRRVELLERLADDVRVVHALRDPAVHALQRRPARAPDGVAGRRELEQLRASVGRVGTAGGVTAGVQAPDDVGRG